MPRKEHIPAIDGLRGIACLMIFMGHFLQQNNNASHSVPLFWIYAFSQYWSGVDLFFVISGFVIFLSLSSLGERTSGMAFFKSYFTSRAFRILPVYFLLILSYYYIPFNNKLMNSDLFISTVPSQVYLVFGQSWWMVAHHREGAPFVFPSWSLCAEVFLYVLSFLIICFAPRKHLIKTLAAFAATSLILRIYIAVAGGDLFAAYLLPICRMDGFMLGGIIALLYAGDRLPSMNVRFLNGVILLLSLGFVAMTVGNVAIFGRFAIVFGYAFDELLFAAILVRVIMRNVGFLSRGPLQYVGVVSYFVYMFHFPIVYGISYVNINVGLRLILTFGVVLAAATVSWFGLEKPLISRGKSLNRGRENPVQLPA